MSLNNQLSQYQENQMKTTTPGKLLLMAFDAAIRFINVATEKMKEGKLDEQGANITKAQNIILELMSSLDMDKDRELANALYNLYSYIFDRLTHASIRDDLQAMEEVVGILSEMRATWAEAEHLVRTGRHTAVGMERIAA